MSQWDGDAIRIGAVRNSYKLTARALMTGTKIRKVQQESVSLARVIL